MDSLAIFIAKYLIVVPVVATIYLLYKTPNRKRLGMLLILGGILSIILAKIASHLYWDPRPFVNGDIKPLFTASRDNGFPSDHTLLSAFLAFVALLYSKRLGWALLAVAILIGWARVFAGVHHAVDVVASILITAVSVFIVNQALKASNRSKNRHPKPEKAQ